MSVENVHVTGYADTQSRIPGVSGSNDAVVVFDRRGYIIHINKFTLELWKYQDAHQLVGTAVADLWVDPQAWLDACAGARQYGQSLFRLYGRCGTGEQERFEVLLDEDSGGHSTIVCRTVDTALATTTPDALVARILEMTNIAIIACNEMGTIIQGNEQSTLMFGYHLKELVGLSVHQLVPPHLRDLHAEHLRTFIHSPITMIPMDSRGEITGCRKNGEQFPAEASLSKFRDDGHWVVLASIRDLTTQQQHAARAHWLTTHDALTNLPNRLLVREQLTEALARARTVAAQIAVLLIDLDGFSTVNGNYGYNTGDNVLVAISERLTKLADAGDVVGRLDGKTFIFLREHSVDRDAVFALAGNINTTIRQPLEFSGQRFSLTASIGIVIGDGSNYNTDEILRDADVAMREVKKHGKDSWLLFNLDIHNKVLRRANIVSRLQAALERNEFSIRLQPIVDALCGTLRGAEVLLRWNPTYGPVFPDEFIPIAEQEGTIVPIGMWVFAQACRIAAQLQQKYGKHAPYLTVNVSARQLGDPKLVETIINYLQQYNVYPANITLELTETGLMADTKANVAVLNCLVESGLNLAVDDFGTGYSSLLQLLRLPVSTLKIDKAFIGGIEKRGEQYAIVDSVLKMSRSLSLTTVAEGVERQGQAELLRQLGCDLLQGYYFSKPVEEQNFFALVAKNHGQPLAIIRNVAFVIYSSIAKGNLTREDLYDILKKARMRNAQLDITGCLFYLDGGFLQYLEGPADALHEVMAIIKADQHHYAVKEIVAGEGQRRMFLNWRMSFGHLATDDMPTAVKELRNQNLGHHGLDAISANPWLAYNLFHAMSLGLET